MSEMRICYFCKVEKPVKEFTLKVPGHGESKECGDCFMEIWNKASEDDKEF